MQGFRNEAIAVPALGVHPPPIVRLGFRHDPDCRHRPDDLGDDLDGDDDEDGPVLMEKKKRRRRGKRP